MQVKSTSSKKQHFARKCFKGQVCPRPPHIDSQGAACSSPVQNPFGGQNTFTFVFSFISYSQTYFLKCVLHDEKQL